MSDLQAVLHHCRYTVVAILLDLPTDMVTVTNLLERMQIDIFWGCVAPLRQHYYVGNTPPGHSALVWS